MYYILLCRERKTERERERERASLLNVPVSTCGESEVRKTTLSFPNSSMYP